MQVGIYGVYTRLSVVREGVASNDDVETSPERQARDCTALCEVKGWQIGDVYSDVDLSAYKENVRRPDFERLLGDLAAGRINGVVCWKIDRLVRNHGDFQRLWSICEQTGATLVSLHEQFDTSTPAGEFVVRMMVGMAKMESQNIALRVTSALAARARAGKPVMGGSRRPFGYAPDRATVMPEEAEVIREASQRLLAGDSLRRLAHDLNARGVSTSTGVAWTPRSLRRVLANPRNAGLRSYRGEVVADGSWDPVVDRATWEQVVALLGEPGRNNQTGRPPKNLLVGSILKCALCGESLIARMDKDRRRRYVCIQGDRVHSRIHLSVTAAPLEELVTETVFAALDGGGLARALAGREQGEDAQLAAELQADEQALEQLANDHYADRIITRAEYLAARATLEQRIRRARSLLARHASTGLITDLPHEADAIRRAWPSWDLDRRRALLGVVLEAVIVNPAVKVGSKTFDPGRVPPASFIWRV